VWTKHLSIPKAKAGPKEFRFRLVSLYLFPTYTDGPSWSWSYGSWIYNYLCNQCLSLLKLWVPIPLSRGVLDTTLCDKVCQWLAEGLWFFPGSPVSSTNKTDCHDITKTLLKVMLNTINPKLKLYSCKFWNSSIQIQIYLKTVIVGLSSIMCAGTKLDTAVI
jgi:hypothetical protein